MEIGVCSHPPAVGVRSQPRRAWGVLAPRSLVPRSSPGSATALSWRSPFPNQPCSSLSPEPRPPLLPALLPAPPIRSRFFGVLVFPEALQICRARNSLELSRENPFSSLRSDFCCRLFTAPAPSRELDLSCSNSRNVSPRRYFPGGFHTPGFAAFCAGSLVKPWISGGCGHRGADFVSLLPSSASWGGQGTATCAARTRTSTASPTRSSAAPTRNAAR